MVVALSWLLACGSGEGTPEDVPSEACAEDEAWHDGACVPESCAAGMWGALPVDASTVYVAPGGTGDGSAANPLGSIQEGADLAGSRDGGLVAVAAGTYDENLVLESAHDGVLIAGVCRERVRVVGRPRDTHAVFDVVGARRKPDIALSGVTLEGGADFGVGITFARVTLTSVDVRGNVGGGITVNDGSAVDVTDAVISGNTTMGVYAADVGTVVTLVDTEVSDTTPNADGLFGRGVEAGVGAEVHLERARIARNADNGVRSAGRATRVTARDTEILDTRLNADGRMGRGAVAAEGASLTLTGCTVKGSHHSGVIAADTGTVLELDDVRILDTSAQEDGRYGDGLAAYEGAEVRGTGVTVERSESQGVYVSGGAVLELSDSTVDDTNPLDTHPQGFGVSVRTAAVVRLTDVVVRRASRQGILVSEEGSLLEGMRLTIEDTRPDPDSSFGDAGLYVVNGGQAVVRSGRIERYGAIGAYAFGAGSRLRLEDSRVADGRGDGAGDFGWGVQAREGGSVELVDSAV